MRSAFGYEGRAKDNFYSVKCFSSKKEEMGKHFGGRTKKTYSKSTVRETKEAFRQRLKKPCPKFEDLFKVDKDKPENIFDSPPVLKKPLFPSTKRVPLSPETNSSSFTSGNDTFDAIIKSKSTKVQNVNNLKSCVNSPELPFFSTTSTANSTNDNFLSAFQSPQTEELSVSICKGGKGWRRSLKKLSTINDSQSQTPQASFLDSFGFKNYKKEILKLCEQVQEIPFTECFNESVLEKCKKIGEGLFGEVFLINVDEHSETEVLKLMPIEGDLKVNGEIQKTFQQMIPEIIISKHLSNLRHSTHSCPSFVKMNRCWCLIGTYSHEMIDLWDGYAATKGSDNDRPDKYPEEQLHLALQYEFAGQDLEAYVFNNGRQAYSVFLQIAYALGVAELEISFEHRDLHWGNVLIRQTSDTVLEYTLKGKPLKIKTYGVKATIIDFTLSRMSSGKEVYFNDLSTDPELFINEGDYQFTIYRKMQQHNNDSWIEFKPKSNIFWLHYLLLKIKDHCYYKNKSSKIHKEGIKDVQVMINSILDYESSLDLVCDLENIT